MSLARHTDHKTVSFVDESTDIASEYILLEDGSPSPISPQLMSYPVRSLSVPRIDPQQQQEEPPETNPQVPPDLHDSSSSDSSPPALLDLKQASTSSSNDFDIMEDIFEELINFDTPKSMMPDQMGVVPVTTSSEMMLVSSPSAFNFVLKTEDHGIHYPTSLDPLTMTAMPLLKTPTNTFPSMTDIEAQLFRHYTQTVAACVCTSFLSRSRILLTFSVFSE